MWHAHEESIAYIHTEIIAPGWICIFIIIITNIIYVASNEYNSFDLRTWTTFMNLNIYVYIKYRNNIYFMSI